MKIPKIRKLPSGNYFCYLRINGQSIPITEPTEDKCRAKALAYKTGLLEQKNMSPADATLRNAIDRYIQDRKNVLSPSTIRGYRTIQRNRFQGVMDKPIRNVKNWQRIVDAEAKIAAPKTVRNAWGFVRSVLSEYEPVKKVRLPQPIKPDPKYLRPEEIPLFVAAISTTEYAVPALLALSSMRLSEIKALQWDDIPKDPDFIPVRGSVVPDENNRQIRRKHNKNVSSARNVPVLIPELVAALKRDRGSGPVLAMSESALRRGINRICRQLEVAEVGVHGLRHSFASLAYHLQIPEKIAMEIGGWSDDKTMRNIYTHIAESDIARFKKQIYSFYNSKNVNEIANGI